MGKRISQYSFVGVTTCPQKEPVPGMLISTSRETSTPVRPKNGGEKSIKCFFPAELIFFHKASKTLIITDTILNLELDKMTEPWRTATKLTGMYYPFGQIFFGMRLPLLLQRQKAEAAIRKIHSWQPQRILLSHGRYFDTDADLVIRRIFGEPPR
jgi:hypothetical protein